MEMVYEDKKGSVHWSAARNEEHRPADKMVANRALCSPIRFTSDFVCSCLRRSSIIVLFGSLRSNVDADLSPGLIYPPAASHPALPRCAPPRLAQPRPALAARLAAVRSPALPRL